MGLRVAFPKGLLDRALKGGLDRKKARRYALCLGLPVLVMLAGFTLYSKYLHVKKSVSAGRRDIARMELLKAEYLEKKAAFDSVAGKAVPSGESPVAAVEEMAKRTGIKGKITSIKPLEDRTADGYTDRSVEVKLEGVDMNQLVNFLYRAEHGGRLVIIRGLSIKERFEDRDLVDVTLRASVVTGP